MKSKIFITAMVSLFFLFPTLSQAGFVILSGHAFTCRTHEGQYYKEVSHGSENGMYITGETNWLSRYYVAPVFFPDSAQGKYLKKMSATVYDNDDSGNMYVQLFKVNLFTGVGNAVYYVGTTVSGTPGKVTLHETTRTGGGLVDNRKWAWYVCVYFAHVPSPHDNLQFYTVRIKY